MSNNADFNKLTFNQPKTRMKKNINEELNKTPKTFYLTVKGIIKQGLKSIRQY